MSFIDKFNYNRNKITDTVSETSTTLPDHGYSLFNLNGSSNQYVVDVVDVSTNSTGSYTATHLRDGTLEAAISDIGVVSKFYDQFGGKHATGVNDDTGLMPFIITGGNFIKLGDKPAMIFRSGDGNTDNRYLSIKAPGTSASNNSSHILGVDGIEAFATVSLEENAQYTTSSPPYNNSYIFGENFGYAVSDYALGFIRDGSNNRLTLYTERGTANSFARGSVAADTDVTKHGYAYTGELVTLGQRYTINSFAKFDEANDVGVVGIGTGQNYASGEVSTGIDNYIIGTIGSDETYDKTFKGKLQELLFYTSLRDDRAAIYSEIQDRLSKNLDYLTSFATFRPTYGAQMSFQAENSSWKGSSFYQFISPMGLNNIKLRSKLSFINNLTQTKKLLNYIESITTGVLTGEEAFTGDTSYLNFGSSKNGVSISFDTGYYRNFSGSQIVDYTVVDLSDDVYKIDVSLFNNTISPVLNNGMAFVNDLTKDEKSTTGFSKFDVIKSTGTNEFKWYCFEDGTADIAAPFTGTTVSQESFDGTSTSVSINPATNPTGVSISITAGNVIKGTKYIHAMDRADHHRIVPFSASGKTFGFSEARNDPHEVFVLALEDGAQVKMYIDQTNGINGNASNTLNLDAGETGSFDINSASDSVVILDSNKNIICSREGSDGYDNAILTPVDVDVYRRRKLNGAVAQATTINSSPATVTDHYVSDPNGVFTTEAGDGAGANAAGHLGFNSLTNLASWANTLVDYAIVSPFSGSINVSYYTGDSWQVLNTHSLNGSKTSPDYIFRNGDGAVDTNGTLDQAGDGSKFSVNGVLPKLWKFESTCPVGIWINDTAAVEGVLIGTNNFLEKGQSIFDDYFYVTEDQEAIGPLAGEDVFAGSNGVTRTFFWEPDRSVPLTIQHANRSIAFKNSFTKTLNVSNNQNNINEIELTFTNRSEKETYSILHFLESHLGYKHFVYYHNNDAINKNRVFYCPKWDHALVYKDSNNIKATFVEIVAPTIPR
tara:strand:- start:6136 stop:9132 length:2997 start_codon:yes stop_codon:yes gene_type:complete